MANMCEVGQCPPGAQTELVVTCTGNNKAPANCSGMQCRFRGGLAASATYDDENQTFSCTAPQGLSATELMDFKVFDGEGAFLCDVGDCPALQSCDSTASVEKEPKEVGGTGLPACVPAVALGLGPEDGGDQNVTIAGVLKAMSFLDRYLAVWVLAAMIIGVLVGNFAPGIKNGFNVAEISGTSLPIAVGLWLMMWPVLSKVRYELIGSILRQKGVLAQIGVSLLLNWLVGPLLMLGLAWATLPDLDHYRNGVILVGLARCIAMVLLWNELAKGDAEFCAIVVAINSVMQIIMYSPLALFYLKVVSRQYQTPGSFNISFWVVARSVLIFLGAPLAAAILTRIIGVWAKGRVWYDTKFAPKLGPIALVALLYTIFVIFSLQGRQVIDNIGSVFRVAVPMFLYFSIMWTGTFFSCWRLGLRYDVSVVQAFTASSNNFELAIAVAVGVFGINSPEALAATVGPLIEVPVLLGLVYVALGVQKKFGWK